MSKQLFNYSLLVACANAYGRTLADCQAVAGLFDNTCSSTTTPIDLDTHTGSLMQCEGNNHCPDGDGTSDSCSWYRKFCITCSEENNETYIRVQTNSFPNHCIHGIDVNPKTYQIDFTVKFNYDMSGIENYSASDIDTAEKTTELICDLQRTGSTNLIDELDYQANITPTPPGPPHTVTPVSRKADGQNDSEEMPSFDGYAIISGIALTGAPIFNALTGPGGDPFYPSEGLPDEIQTTDECASHSTPEAGNYHYHIWSNCINNGSKTTTPDMCYDEPACKDDFINFVINNGKNTNGQVIGIAKDGHLIYGPYNTEGELYSCEDRDICNGKFMDDGSYAYVSTTTHPYVVGCWGPGATQTNAQTCSVNACGSSVAAAAVSGLIFQASVSIFASIILFNF